MQILKIGSFLALGMFLVSACTVSTKDVQGGGGDSVTSNFMVTHDLSIADTSGSGGNVGVVSRAAIHARSGSLGGSPFSYDFGVVAPGHSASRDLYVYNFGNEAIAVDTISVLNDNGTDFTAQPPVLPLTLAPGESMSFAITFAPAQAILQSKAKVKVKSRHHGTYTAELSGSSRTDVGDIALYGGKDPYQYLLPNEFRARSQYGNVGVAPVMAVAGGMGLASCDWALDVSTPLEIRNDGGGALKVTRSELSGPQANAFVVNGLTVPATVPAGGKLPFSLDIDVTKPTGVYLATLTLTTDSPIPGKNKYIVQIARYNPGPRPCLTLDAVSDSPRLLAQWMYMASGPMSLVPIGINTTAHVTLTLSNAGSADMNIQPGDIRLSGNTSPKYSAPFNSSPVTIAPGESQTFTITLSTGTTTGPAEGTVEISGTVLGYGSTDFWPVVRMLADVVTNPPPSNAFLMIAGPGVDTLNNTVNFSATSDPSDRIIMLRSLVPDVVLKTVTLVNSPRFLVQLPASTVLPMPLPPELSMRLVKLPGAAGAVTGTLRIGTSQGYLDVSLVAQ